MSKPTPTLPPIGVLGRVGPIQVGTVAAGLVGACSIATLFGLVNMSLGRVLIMVSANVMYMMIGGTAMWLVLRAPKIGPGICATAGAAAGLTAAVALVVVIEVFRRGEGSSVAGLVMIFVAAFGLVFGLLLGVALTRFVQAIARAAASSALDRADRARSCKRDALTRALSWVSSRSCSPA